MANFLKYQIDLRFAIILGDISTKHRNLILTRLADLLRDRQKIPNEELIHVLSLLRYVQYFLGHPNDIKVAEKMVRDLLLLFEEANKAVLKQAVGQLLERIVFQFDFSQRNEKYAVPDLIAESLYVTVTIVKGPIPCA